MKRILFYLMLIGAAPLAAQEPAPASREAALDKANGVVLFRGVDGTYFDLESDAATQSAVSYLNILDWLSGRVAGLQVYRVRGVPVPWIRNRPAALYIDEMPVDPVFFQALSVHDIALVKVMKGPIVFPWSSPGGVIAVYTKGGEES
ncbi:MAG: hypothetical protein EOP84_24060 [Verrucomicrobiaceae bacterium]|nr:MAG: hypothetical protein EOP84_24060 [Verrucomicrobiaceae bacterium]